MDIRLFYHGDDFVIPADENDLQWFAEPKEALIVKVRGVLGADNGNLEAITLLNPHRVPRSDHE